MGIDFRNFAFQPYSLDSAANGVNHIFFIAAELPDGYICCYAVMKGFNYKIGNLFIFSVTTIKYLQLLMLSIMLSTKNAFANRPSIE